MAVDTPARIAVLGAGPIGIEAALYARFLGYDVVVLEQGEVADSVRRWGQVRMFSPFALNRSPLGLAALTAQDEQFTPPADDALLTGNEWRDQYLIPLSQTDLLADHIRTQTQVIAVSKVGYLKQDAPGDEDRGEADFRILVSSHAGEEELLVDAVIDATGVFGNPNRLGPGGSPAIGESQFPDRITYELPDFLDVDRQRYAGQRVLLIGNGYSAATSLVALSELAIEAPATRVVWLTRRPAQNPDAPFQVLASDRLPERAGLAVKANQAISSAAVRSVTGAVVRQISKAPDEMGLIVELDDEDAAPIECDEIVANVGYRPNVEMTRELHAHLCYASEGPMKLAARLLGNASTDCLDQTSAGPDALITPEPHFYVLGAKSYGRNSNFLVSLGLDQIREVFSVIGDRADLNLYESAHTLLE